MGKAIHVHDNAEKFTAVHIARLREFLWEFLGWIRMGLSDAQTILKRDPAGMGCREEEI
jgi:hypothetical protein